MRMTRVSLLRWLTVLLLAWPTTVVTVACGAEGEIGTDTGGGGDENEGDENEGDEGGEEDTDLEGEVETETD